MLRLLKQSWKSKDIPSLALFAIIAIAGLWIAALPLSTAVQETYLRRFHLASANFPGWAIQQAIPSMYNFENKVWVCPEPLMQFEVDQLKNEEAGISESSAGQTNGIQSTMVNHFPTRIATFAETRTLLKRYPNGYLYLRSRYRGKEIKTTFKVEPGTDAEFNLKRVVTSFE